MRKRAVAMSTVKALLARLTGAGAAEAGPGAAGIVRWQPKAITLSDHGATVVLPVGAAFLLELGAASPDWRVQVADEAVLARLPGIAVLRGAQGVYRAAAPGRTTLTAIDPAAAEIGRSDPDGCAFHVTILVRTGAPAQVRFAPGERSYVVDGLTLPMDTAPFLAQKRLYVPLRDLAAALGASDTDLVWEPERQVVTVRLATTQLRVQAGRHALVVNKVPVTTDAPALLRDDQVCVPLRWVAEALGYQVTWDPAARAAVLGR